MASLILNRSNQVCMPNGFVLGRFLDYVWIPNQCLVGSILTDQELSRLMDCQVCSSGLLSVGGAQVAQIERLVGSWPVTGRIISLEIFSQNT